MFRKFLVTLTVCVLLLGGLLFFFSPFFHITDVRVTGNENISAEEILERADVGSAQNILLFNAGEARRRVMENLYIDQAVFTKTFPNQLTIAVSERHLSGYVEYLEGKYLFIDENGRVMEINSARTEQLPVVSGLKFDRVRLGEILEVEDAGAFKTVVRYARLLSQHGMAGHAARIDVSDSANTRILYYQIEFNVGDDRDADEKVRTIKEIFAKTPDAEVIKGFVNLREIRAQYELKILL